MEDWLEEDARVFGPPSFTIPKPKTVLSVFNTLYKLTEIFEFASRLAQKHLFDSGLYTKKELNGMRGRRLKIFDRRRASLLEGYVCRVVDVLPKEWLLEVEEIIDQSHDLALNHAIWVYERFNWRKLSIEVLKEAQVRFLERRL